MNPSKALETIDRLRSGMRTVRENSKAVVHEGLGTLIGGAASAGIGAWDEAKGAPRDNDNGITTAYLGPVPAALVVAAVGKVAALSMTGDGESHYASMAGQAGVDCWSYVMGRRGWIRHKAAKKA